MRYWLRGKRGGLLAFVAIASLVAGGLGWVTAAVLRLEREQLEASARAELDHSLSLAMWKLEARVARALAIEDSRPYNHYSAVYATARAFVSRNGAWRAETVLLPSPLLGTELPEWALLHFQIDQAGKYSCPEVLSQPLVRKLEQAPLDVCCENVTPYRARLLAQLKSRLRPGELLDHLRARGEQLGREGSTFEPANSANFSFNSPDNSSNSLQMPPQKMLGNEPQSSYQSRAGQLSKFQNEGKKTQEKENRDLIGRNVHDPESWFGRPLQSIAPGDSVLVSRGPFIGLWVTDTDDQERLIAARLVYVGEREICQGILLDWDRLQDVLSAETADLLPNARFEPMTAAVPAHPERTIVSLPIEVMPGFDPLAIADPGWTPLRVGLLLAWAAALIALLAVGLGSWSLLDLSERRIRFVSAVTHELRTPLTTLRLYLDMLTGGLVREEKQKDEYLHTLHAEADRLHRLIANVLDFSRLEDQRPHVGKWVV